MVILPEELLHSIVKCVNRGNAFQHQSFSVPPPELYALSCVNHQFRRITRPFLFAAFITKSTERIVELCEGIEDGKATFHGLIRTVAISPALSVEAASRIGDHTCSALAELLPKLPSIRTLDLRTLLDLRNLALTDELLSVVNAHKSLELVRTVACPPLGVDEAESMDEQEDLEEVSLHKVVVTARAMLPALSPRTRKLQQQGLRISEARLLILSSTPGIPIPHLIRGLKYVYFHIYEPSDDLSWIQSFAERHPELQHIQLKNFTDITMFGLSIPLIAKLAPLEGKADFSEVVLVRDKQFSSGSESVFGHWKIRTIVLHSIDRPSPIAVSETLQTLKVACPDLVILKLVGHNKINMVQEKFVDDLAICLPRLEDLHMYDIGKLLQDTTDRQMAMRSFVIRLAGRLPDLHRIWLEAANDPAGDEVDDDAFDLMARLRVNFRVRDRLVSEGGGLEVIEEVC